MIVSLDGFIEGPHQELDWFQDGDPHFERYCDEMIDSVGLALYGRRSYELMLAYWPNAEKSPHSPQDLAFARKMNALPKVVLSRTLERAEWNNTRIVKDYRGGLARCQVHPHRGGWVLLFWYEHDDGDKVRSVATIDVEGDRVARLRNYFFTPDVIAEICVELGVPYRVNGYRYW